MPMQSNELYLRYTHNASAFCLFLPVVSVVACHHASAVQCCLSSLASLPVLSTAFFFRKLLWQSVLCFLFPLASMRVLAIFTILHVSAELSNVFYLCQSACRCCAVNCPVLLIFAGLQVSDLVFSISANNPVLLNAFFLC